MRTLIYAAVAASLAFPAAAQTLRPDQVRFRALYKELVETNTTLSAGDCTLAAAKMAAHLKAAGYPDAELHPFAAPGHPKEGGLVAVLHGSDLKAKAVLLLGHLDVVEAKREDWTRDPFTLIEENGYFYGRGTTDMKAQDAAWVDTMVRYKEEGFKPRRDIKMALTCGEETSTAFNGASYLATHERALIDAGFALNEGGGVGLKDGKPIRNSVQTSEKVSVSFQLDVTNSGGHSSVPRKDNAIYRLAEGLGRLSKFEFPLHLNETTRAYFERTAQSENEQTSADIRAVLADQPDAAALVRLASNPGYNAQLRTTCVATMLQGGHAVNALPQLAEAKVNCRIMPGEAIDEVKATLERVLADDQIKVTQIDKGVLSEPSKLNEDIVGAIEKLSREFWPSAVVLPVMSSGATDGSYLRNAGIPTYGHSGMANDVHDIRAHGRDERVPIKSFYQGNEYLYRLVKALSGGT